MTPPLLDHLRSDSERFVAVLESTDPTAPVPTCPGWDAADLFWHLTEVQHFWGAILSVPLRSPADYARPERPAVAGLARAFRDAHTRLTDALADRADDEQAWTWHPAEQHVGFIRRRQAHEAAVHRLDAELTVDQRTPIDPGLATDGVLEALEWIFGGAPEWAEVAMDGPTGRLSTTDTRASWAVRIGRFSGTNPDSGERHDDAPMLALGVTGDATFEVSAPAADLLAWIWDRPPVVDVITTGDIDGLVAVLRSLDD